MAAYRTASRLFPGLHQPLLGMGCEYARMNNNALAEQVLRSAHAVCPQVGLLGIHGGQVQSSVCITRPMNATFSVALYRVPRDISGCVCMSSASVCADEWH